MKRRWSLFFILIILLVSIPGAFASFGVLPYVSGSYGVNLCHSTAQYLENYPGDETIRTPFFRTSSFFSIDAQLLEAAVSFKNGDMLSFGGGFSAVSVSQSRPWGRSVLKPYYGLGLSFDMTYSFSCGFSLAARYRYLFCTFTGSLAGFIAHEAELVPAYTFAAPWALDIAVTLPLTVSLKADAVSLRAGIGMRIALDSKRMGGVQ